jgi:hypothetical protein
LSAHPCTEEQHVQQDRVRVWAGDDRSRQHLTTAPTDSVVRQWEGTTDCGVHGELHWIHGEVVDTGLMCPDCAAAAGSTQPSLEGEWPGPV